MNIKIPSIQIKRLKTVMRAIPKLKTPNPELAMLFISTTDDGAELCYYSGSFYLSFFFFCITTEEGGCTIPQDIFRKALKGTPCDIEIISGDESTILKGANGVELSFAPLKVIDYPRIAPEKFICDLHEEEFDFLDKLGHCKFQLNEKKLFIGSEGFVLGIDNYQAIQYNDLVNDVAYCIDFDSIPLIKAIFDDECGVYLDNNNILLANDRCMFYLKTTVVNLPPIKPKSPDKNNSFLLRINAFKKAVLNISPISERTGKVSTPTIASLDISPKNLSLSVNSGEYLADTNICPYMQTVAIPCEGNISETIHINLAHLKNLSTIMPQGSKASVSIYDDSFLDFECSPIFLRTGLINRKAKERNAA